MRAEFGQQIGTLKLSGGFIIAAQECATKEKVARREGAVYR